MKVAETLCRPDQKQTKRAERNRLIKKTDRECQTKRTERQKERDR